MRTRRVDDRLTAIARPFVIVECTAALLVSLGSFEQMVAELGFDRSLDDANLTTKDSLVEFGNHLSWGKRSERSTLLSGGARGVLSCECGEIFPTGNECF